MGCADDVGVELMGAGPLWGRGLLCLKALLFPRAQVLLFIVVPYELDKDGFSWPGLTVASSGDMVSL